MRGLKTPGHPAFSGGERVLQHHGLRQAVDHSTESADLCSKIIWFIVAARRSKAAL